MPIIKDKIKDIVIMDFAGFINAIIAGFIQYSGPCF